VSTHVERVLRKLGVANRVAAAVRATELDLYPAEPGVRLHPMTRM
jgi:ATP/maltotriose-dependent transcriptional regulator MalT